MILTLSALELVAETLSLKSLTRRSCSRGVGFEGIDPMFGRSEVAWNVLN
jgi:hypothetical protein